MPDVEQEHRLLFEKRLFLQCASLFVNEKPACLLHLSDHQKLPMASLWSKYGDELIIKLPWNFSVIKMEAHHYTLLIYDPEKLERTLYHYRFFLERFGYPSFTSLKRFFIHLRYRFCTGFPHEIGIVLGIRPKDVLGFLGLNELPLTLSGSWKVYGDHAREKDLFREIHSIQQRIRWGLDEGNDVETLIHIFSQ